MFLLFLSLSLYTYVLYIYTYIYYLCDHGLRLRMHRQGTRQVNQAVSFVLHRDDRIAMRLIYGHEIVDLTIGVWSI